MLHKMIYFLMTKKKNIHENCKNSTTLGIRRPGFLLSSSKKLSLQSCPCHSLCVSLSLDIYKMRRWDNMIIHSIMTFHDKDSQSKTLGCWLFVCVHTHTHIWDLWVPKCVEQKITGYIPHIYGAGSQKAEKRLRSKTEAEGVSKIHHKAELGRQQKSQAQEAEIQI